MRRRYLLFIIPAFFLFTGLTFASGVIAGRFGLVLPAGSSASSDAMANFTRVKNLVQEKYVKPVNEADLINGATRGLVEGTGDPYSTYLSPEEAQQLSDALSGSVEGIGVEIGEKDEGIIVIAPLPDSPAARAGIRAGDAIVAVGEEPTAGKTVDQVAKQIRGPKGTEVTIQVRSAESPVPRAVKMVRATVKAPSVTLTYQGDVAVIRLTRFGDETKAELDRAVADIQAKKPRGIVLDMRSNPGGFLDGAISVSSVFLDGGVVVREEFARGKSETRRVQQDGRLATLPLVVLVDKGSASAAEITAGALRDNRGIKLVGEKTFGKGSVQELQELRGGGVLKLTVAEWLTPKGTSISKQGLEPDVAVPGADPDAQLQAAVTAVK